MGNFGMNLHCRYITSDCDAVSIIHDNQGYAKSPEDAVADVLKAGMYNPNPALWVYKILTHV